MPGKTKTCDAPGTIFKYDMTLGIKLANKTNAPYISTRNPIMGQPMMMITNPRKKKTLPFHLPLVEKNITARFAPKITTMPHTRAKLPTANSFRSKNSSTPRAMATNPTMHSPMPIFLLSSNILILEFNQIRAVVEIHSTISSICRLSIEISQYSTLQAISSYGELNFPTTIMTTFAY